MNITYISNDLLNEDTNTDAVKASILNKLQQKIESQQAKVLARFNRQMYGRNRTLYQQQFNPDVLNLAEYRDYISLSESCELRLLEAIHFLLSLEQIDVPLIILKEIKD